jgi:hypothetical protein
MLQFYIAKELGMSLSQVRTTMTQEEILGWNAFFHIQSEQEKEAYEKAKRRR